MKRLTFCVLLALAAVLLVGLFETAPAFARSWHHMMITSALYNVGDEPKAAGEWTTEMLPGGARGNLTVSCTGLTRGATYQVDINGYSGPLFVARSNGRGGYVFPDAGIPDTVGVYRVESTGPVLVLVWPLQP